MIQAQKDRERVIALKAEIQTLKDATAGLKSERDNLIAANRLKAKGAKRTVRLFEEGIGGVKRYGEWSKDQSFNAPSCKSWDWR